ncbi:hypothetical protein PGT21_001058 [Puccinia graminis f. sp. tritici]|uniref:Uncharacterized protein n=1 Tax=Puccinia graminis f. sp. tritici TaxID=56615 RepID=A0A5B0Q1D7_PUCGR|nr:hypothetical protein PGT21_001058 [Puccinia graminis f. sp. tritici]
MAPPPQVVVVVKNEGGKEIGGGNHYCTICRTPALPTPPGSLASAHLLVHVGRALTPRFGKPQFLGPLGYEPRGALTAISI